MSVFVDYCKYKIKSKDEHGVHSPFVFDLVTNVIYNDKDYYAYKTIESIRAGLPESEKQDMVNKLNPAKYGQLLFRLVDKFQPENVVEVGSSFGIETAYLASANSSIPVTVISDSKQMNLQAESTCKNLGLKNIDFVIADIGNNLKYLKKDSLIYFHGRKTEKKLSDHLYQCIEKMGDSGVIVISDLYISDEMKNTWNSIKNHERAKVTIDLFYLGIVFFRKEQVKEHFLIRF